MSSIPSDSAGIAPGEHVLLSIGDTKPPAPPSYRASRAATWPIIGFLMGFAWSPGFVGATTAREFLVTSIIVGAVWAFVGWLAALIFGRWRGPTQTALPYSQGTPAALLFNFSILALVAMKMLEVRGILPIAIAIIPIAIVSRGATRAASTKPPLPPEVAARIAQMKDPRHLARTKAQMERAAAHPKVSANTRERMLRHIRNLTAVEAKLTRDRQHRRALWLKAVSGTAILTAWIGYFAFSFHLASTRVDECRHTPSLHGQQESLCIRHAIEARDMTLLIGLGGAMLAVVSVLIWLNLRLRPRRNDDVPSAT